MNAKQQIKLLLHKTTIENSNEIDNEIVLLQNRKTIKHINRQIEAKGTIGGRKLA